MRRILIAFRIFFRVLFESAVADQAEQVLAGRALPAPVPPAAEPAAQPPIAPKPPTKEPAPARPAARSDGLTLLATLQREARFVDFVKEELDNYTDAQIGAVARDVHRDSGKVLERMFQLRPVVAAEEGAAVDVPAGFDAGRYRLTGKVTGDAGQRGELVHHGWEATACEVPAWTGSAAAARVVAPAEVELK